MKVWLVFLLGCFAVGTAGATCSPPVEQALSWWDYRVAKLQNQAPIGKILHKVWVKKKLAHMVKLDQAVRDYLSTPKDQGWSEKDSQCFFEKFSPRWAKVDDANTEDLKKILVRHHWFFRNRWGAQADDRGWLLVQHADRDRPFQIQILKRLRMLVKTGGTKPAHYAYLHDRVAAAWSEPEARRPQRFGTQGQCQPDGTWKPLPLEDPARVDEWRRSVGLGPMDEYISGFKEICTP